MKKLTLIALLFLLCPLFTFASPAHRCEVRVTYLLKSGVIEEAKVGTLAKSKKECERKARTLKVHSAPTKVRKKFFAIDWKPRR